MGYQVYHLSAQFSWALVALTIFDGLIVWLIRHEYLYLKHQANAQE